MCYYNPMLTFQEIHAYKKLVESGKAEPLLCPINPEDGEIIPSWESADEVILICLICNSKVVPGINMAKKVKEKLY